MTVSADFAADARSIILNQLSTCGFMFDPDATLEKIVRQRIAVAVRTIARRPRAVHFAQELGTQRVDDDLRAGLDRIAHASEAGDDLTPYLHTKIKKAPYDDVLLNAWGLHHFHLGVLQPGQPFAARTSDLLFALVVQDAYSGQVDQ